MLDMPQYVAEHVGRALHASNLPRSSMNCSINVVCALFQSSCQRIRSTLQATVSATTNVSQTKTRMVKRESNGEQRESAVAAEMREKKDEAQRYAAVGLQGDHKEAKGFVLATLRLTALYSKAP